MVDGYGRVYFDTNLWVAYIMGDRGGSKDRLFDACAPLFNRVERGRSLVVVSHLVMAETIYSLYRTSAKGFGPIAETTTDHTRIQTECRMAKERLAKYVGGLLANENAEVATPIGALSDHQRKVFAKIYEHFGRIAGGVRTGYKYAGLCHTDIEHAYLASHAGVSTFYSGDIDFGSLNFDPEFRGVSFEILR